MQSAFQWSSPETPTCGSCHVPIIHFRDLLMASCKLELCNPPDRATHISGAGLDCIFISSGHVVDVVVHDGLHVAQVLLCVAQCWGQTISCASQLVCLFPHVQTQSVDQRCRHCAIGDPLWHEELFQSARAKISATGVGTKKKRHGTKITENKMSNELSGQIIKLHPE